MIREDWELTGAATFSRPLFDEVYTIKTYDDSFGSLYVYLESCGPWVHVTGIIRAMSWEDAFSIARDEFCCKVEWSELDPECKKALEENGNCDCHSWSDNNGLVEIDQNEQLHELTPGLVKEHSIVLFTQPI